MPSKSKKVASRQAELANRKRKASKQTTVDKSPISVVLKNRTPTLVNYPTGNTLNMGEHQPIIPEPNVIQEVQTPASEHPRQNLEIMREIKRIAVTTTALLIVLGALTAMLR